MPPRASTLRFPDGILKRAGVVSLQSKQEVVAEARRSLHPVKVAWVNVGDIDDTPTELNSRHAADYAADDALDELAASIREQGILQPLCVRPVGDRYGLVFGMRRLKAAVRAGLQEVPCTIQIADDERAFLLNTIENLHRRQLSGAERVRAIEKLAATDLGICEISRRTGFNPATISRWLKIDRHPVLKRALEAPGEAVATLLDEAATLGRAALRDRIDSLQVLCCTTPGASPRARYLSKALQQLALAEQVAGELQAEDFAFIAQIEASLARLRAGRG
ncbi:MAG: ParB/RepB/Spo0J family partition protein [Chloroflexota bacterium]|nr:ParB/RepB/Spo0J family partition protein [Chloroflexota bacterium]